MNFKIGQSVSWVESRYWSTKHPDECGYNDLICSGMVVSFDAETVIVSFRNFQDGLCLKALTIAETKWAQPTDWVI